MRDTTILRDIFIALIATAIVAAVSYAITLVFKNQVVLTIIMTALIGISGLFIWFYHRKLKQESGERAALGIKDIYPSFSESPSPYEMLNSATSHFDFLGTSGRSFFVLDSGLYKLLEKKLAEGVAIRFLLLDPTSPNLQRRAESEKYSAEAMRRDINTSLETIDRLKARYSGKIDYVIYTSYPIWRCVFIDEREVYVSYYPPGSFGDQSPSVKLVAQAGQASLYKAFRTYFEEKWSEGTQKVQKKQRKSQ